MKRIAGLLVLIIALLHAAIMVMEMGFWDHPIGRRIFAMTPEFSAASKVLAANQGLYNGFLAAGLLWAFLADRRDLKVFFLTCVLVAGVFGGLTAKLSIIVVQALPAALALAAVMLSERRDSAS
jgi:putative membrane protein